MSAATANTTAEFISIPSVCLPRIWTNFDKTYVETVFINLFGPDADNNTCIKRIDLLSRHDNRTSEPYWLAFVHFSDKMLPSELIHDFIARINSGGLSIIYDQENYGNAWWKIRPCTAKPTIDAKPKHGPRFMTIEEEHRIAAANARIQAERIHTTRADSTIDTKDIAAFPPLEAKASP
jgi:hypothetical protein